MLDMFLYYFTQDNDFPFNIHYGHHDENMELHGHADFFELVVVMDGTATHIVENERFAIKKGDVFVMGNGIAHGYENTHNFRICNVMFRPETILSGDYDIKNHPGFHALFVLEPYITTTHGFQNRLTLSPEEYVEIGRMIEFMIKEYNEQNPGRKTAIMSTFMQMVVTLSRLYGETGSTKKEIINLADAAAFVEKHYMDDLTVSGLAEISHYSLRHFIRLFTEAYKTTPQQYIISIRMGHACSLLRESDLLVSEIARRCGFNDINYFSRMFRKSTGLAPSQYRGLFGSR